MTCTGEFHYPTWINYFRKHGPAANVLALAQIKLQHLPSALWKKQKKYTLDRVRMCYMLHLNKRSCIVTNLIGIQWFTRESIVSRHGMARGITKGWIEDTSVSGMQRWMKAQIGRRYFFFLSSPPFAVEILISLARSRSIYTCQRCACRCKACFSCVLRGYL